LSGVCAMRSQNLTVTTDRDDATAADRDPLAATSS
jgi:hypothetical protein